MACYGRSLSREWSGQILCGEVWQNEEGGDSIYSKTNHLMGTLLLTLFIEHFILKLYKILRQ
jgi:hypothetical protein